MFSIDACMQTVHINSETGMRERSIRQLSGGERRRIALALALGFADLTAGRGQLRCNLIVLDEVHLAAVVASFVWICSCASMLLQLTHLRLNCVMGYDRLQNLAALFVLAHIHSCSVPWQLGHEVRWTWHAVQHASDMP